MSPLPSFPFLSRPLFLSLVLQPLTDGFIGIVEVPLQAVVGMQAGLLSADALARLVTVRERLAATEGSGEGAGEAGGAAAATST